MTGSDIKVLQDTKVQQVVDKAIRAGNACYIVNIGTIQVGKTAKGLSVARGASEQIHYFPDKDVVDWNATGDLVLMVGKILEALPIGSNKLDIVIKLAVQWALEASDGNVTAMGRELGLPQKTAFRYVDRLGLKEGKDGTL